MKLIDRLIFSAIAVFLGILAAKAFMPGPVKANPGGVIEVKIVGVGDYFDIPVNINGISSYVKMPVDLTHVGGHLCSLSDLK